MTQSVRILAADLVTHNVRRYRLEKPEGFHFEPGQATELSIDLDGWRDKKQPFTFTALNDRAYLEFTIKSYFDHDGLTKKLFELRPGDRLLLRDVWGTITYNGPGVFLAGGAGVTPFVAILRQLHKDGNIGGHRLIVSNKTEKDIILRTEFEGMFGLDYTWTVTNDPKSTLSHDRIDEAFLKRHISNFGQNFYVCGPDPMVKELRETLGRLGAKTESVTFEK